MGGYLASCMLYNNDGTILSMWTDSQIFSTKSSETVLRTTPYGHGKLLRELRDQRNVVIGNVFYLYAA